MPNAAYTVGAALAGLILLGACTPTSSDSGSEIFAAYCASCHGRDARGDGVLAGELPGPPPDLTLLAAANGGVFPSSRVMQQIYGYPGRYHAQIMPEFGPVLEGPMVIWTDEEGTAIETPRALLDLHDYLASIQTN